MKLKDLSLPTKSRVFVPLHSEHGDVELKLTLRDWQSKEYRALMSGNYKEVADLFSDSSIQNAVSECVASIESWNIDDYECTPENIMQLFSDEGCHWIAFSVQDEVLGKKLLALQNKTGL